MYLNIAELAAIHRLTDGLTDHALIRLTRTDSFSNELPWESEGFVRLRVADGKYYADDVIGETGSISAWS